MIQININDIANKVRSAVLTGLNTALTGAIVASDTVLEAFGKLQNQINGLQSSKANDNDVVKLTGDQTIEGEKTFVDKTGVGVVEFTATSDAISNPDADKSKMYERRYIDSGFKILELVSKDELGVETVVRSNKIEL